MKFLSSLRLYIVAVGALLAMQGAHADFAKAFNCQGNDAPKECRGVLVGTIDSLQAIGAYCPDGNTSYGYIIESWKRWVANNPHISDAPTLLQMRQVLRELNLACGK